MYWYFVHPQFDKQNISLALDTLLLTNATPILGSELGMNYPSWSISSEMISYIVFGVCSIIAMHKNKTKLIVLITILCFGFLAYQQNYFLTGSFGCIRGLACFNMGYLIFKIADQKINMPNWTEWALPLMIVGMMYNYHNQVNSNMTIHLCTQFLIPICFAISIIILIKTNGFLSSLLQSKPLLFLGKISYSVYLNQALVIGYGVPKFFKWIQFAHGDTKKTIAILLVLASLILYSWVTQYLIERKMGKQLAKLWKA
jgi:peptidoglycan/LPS O-acetylase OafA/YrhL